MLWLSTGPGLLTRALARVLAGDLADALKHIRIFEMYELHRAVAMHCVRSYKQSGKHWVRAAFGEKLRTATPKTGGAEPAA